MPTPRTSRARGGQAPIWTRDFVLATCTNLLLATSFMATIVTMAPYAVHDLGASEPQAGAVASIFVVGALLSRPLAGRYLDVIGRRRIALIGIALQVVSMGLYLLATSLPLVLGVRILHGVAFGFVNTALAASVISLLPPRRRSEGTGYFGMSGVIAGALGPVTGLTLYLTASAQVMFIAGVGIVLCALVLALFLRLPSPPPPPTATLPAVASSSGTTPSGRRLRRHSIGPVLRSLLEPAVLPVASVMLLAGAGFGSVMTYLSLYNDRIGMGELTTVFFVVYSVAVLAVRPFAGRMHDRRGDNTIIYPALLFLAVALAVIGIARDPWVLLLGAVFLAMGFGTLMSSMQAIAVTVAPRDRVGVATASFFLMLDIGTGLGPVLLGFAVATLGYSPMYLVMAAVMVLGVLQYHLTHGGTSRRRVGPLPDDPPPADGDPGSAGTEPDDAALPGAQPRSGHVPGSGDQRHHDGQDQHHRADGSK